MTEAWSASNTEFSTSTATSSHFEGQEDFSNLRIRGQEKEMQKLHDVFRHVQRTGSDTKKTRDTMKESSIVLVKGLSGTGKSTLVKSFFADLELKSKLTRGLSKPFFLSGKYEELSGVDPFSAIVEAFGGFVSTLLEGEKGELERIQKAIKDDLGSEATFLTTFIPHLKSIIEDNSPSSGEKENALNRLKFIFRKFSNAIGSRERPVIMFLDDLQWIDPASIELIQALLTDPDLRYFMVIGAYRSDEVEDGHIFQQSLEIIERSQQVEKIGLVNLSLEDLGEVLAETLHMDAGEVMTLAEVIYKKSNGNLFFTMQVLNELRRKGLLGFSRLTSRWQWHIDGFNLDNILSNDLIQVLAENILQSSDILQKALIVAAYTRSKVDRDILRQLMEFDGCIVSSEDLWKALDKAVVDGLLSNNTGSESYCFMHDKIQEAAYSLVPEGDARNRFRLAMGRRLYKLGSSDIGSDWMLYAAADHLNAVTDIHGSDDTMSLVMLNMEVGERASNALAFETASKLMKHVMETLALLKNPWKGYYDITLKAHQLTVHVELMLGHFDIGERITEVVAENATCIEDRLPTHLALAKAKLREAKLREAFEMCTSALRSLDLYPKRNFILYSCIVGDLLYVKRCFRKMSDNEIIGLPLLKDSSKKSAMEFLYLAAYTSYLSGHLVLYLSLILRMLRITFKYGLCAASGLAFYGYCLTENSLDNVDGSIRIFNVSVKVMEKTKARREESLAFYVFAYFISAWKDPLEEVLAHFEHGSKSGMETGEFEIGLMNMELYHAHEYLAGKKLGIVDFKFSHIIGKLVDYKVEYHRETAEAWLLTVQHLRGSAKSTLDFEKLANFEPLMDSNDKIYPALYGYLSRLQIAVYFGNFRFAEEMAKKAKSLADHDKSYIVVILRLFFSSLAYCQLAKLSGKRSYFRKATNICGELIKMSKTKGLNSWHKGLLLQAHIKMTRGNKGLRTVQASYDHAISAAVKCGHIQDAGLGAQLAGEHFLNTKNVDSSSAFDKEKVIRQYFTDARDCYKRWGARALVNHLEKIHHSQFDSLTSYDDKSTIIVTDSHAMVDEISCLTDCITFPANIKSS